MPNSDRARFSLRSLMIFVVLVGIYLAGMLREYQQLGVSTVIMVVGAGCAYLAVEYYYRDLSRWMWLMIASLLLQPVTQLMGVRSFFQLSVPQGSIPWLSIVTMLILAFPKLFGTIMLYRDIRRQLRGYQEQIRLLSAAAEQSTSTAEPPSLTDDEDL